MRDIPKVSVFNFKGVYQCITTAKLCLKSFAKDITFNMHNQLLLMADNLELQQVMTKLNYDLRYP
jgi:hypothetical protein